MSFIKKIAERQIAYNQRNPGFAEQWAKRCKAAELVNTEYKALQSASNKAFERYVESDGCAVAEAEMKRAFDALCEFKSNNPDAGKLLVHPGCRELAFDVSMGRA